MKKSKNAGTNLVVVRDLEPVIACDDMVMNGQDGLRVRLYPGNLQYIIKVDLSLFLV